jgi:hypothetical protein
VYEAHGSSFALQIQMVLVARLKQWVGALSLCPAAGAVGYVIKN